MVFVFLRKGLHHLRQRIPIHHVGVVLPNADECVEMSANFEMTLATLFPCVTVGSVWHLLWCTAVFENFVLLHFFIRYICIW